MAATTNSPQRTEQQTLNVACFGASLTAGYSNRGREYYPYGSFLQTLLTETFQSNTRPGFSTAERLSKVNCESFGEPGEVTAEMLGRIFDQLFPNIKEGKGKWDVVVILGGSNDLGHGVPEHETLSNLGNLARICKFHKAIPFILTIPALGEVLYDYEYSTLQVSLNEGIRAMCSAQKLGFIDLFTSTLQSPATTTNGVERKVLSKEIADVDGLHFTKHGYQVMAQLVHDSICDWFAPGPQSSSASLSGNSVTSNNSSILRVACFGDSLTEGYCKRGSVFYPYGKQLQHLLEQSLITVKSAEFSQANVASFGVSGETTESMLERMEYDLFQRSQVGSKNNGPYNVIVILGGANDLGLGVDIDEVVANLIKMYEACVANRVQWVLMLTVPACGERLFDEGHQQLQVKFNKTLTKAMNGRPNAMVLDLFTKTLAPPKGNANHLMLAAELVDIDGLHLSKRGYERMAEIVHESLVQWLSSQPKVSSAS